MILAITNKGALAFMVFKGKYNASVFVLFLQRLLKEAAMAFSLRPFRRFPVQCFVTYNAGPFQAQGTVWNLPYRRRCSAPGSAPLNSVENTSS